MAKKKNSPINDANTPLPQAGRNAGPRPASKIAPKGSGAADKKNISWDNIPILGQVAIVACIAVITWLFLSPCLDNQLTNWDDPGYIRDDAVIKNISWDGIMNIFSTSIMGNYHPLTILSYAIDYAAKGLDPYRYHLDSLIYHIIVTVLVYVFVNLLTRRPIAAAISALLFGLHPMHMESVAWIAGRKDVVYGMFYMAACITWLYFLRSATNKKWLWYALTVLFFLCSLLGKPVAVILPVSLILIGFFERRKLDIPLLLQTALLFIFSLAFGLKSIKDQGAFGSLNSTQADYSFIERIALGGYAFVTYLWKAVLPVGLCNYYPYPDKINGVLDKQYYLYPLAVIIAAAILVFLIFYKKTGTGVNGKRFTVNRIVVFGLLFFVTNIALLLQFIPVGGAIIADRYSYIPYLGLFIIAGWYISSFFEPGGNRRLGLVALSAAMVYILFLGYQSNIRCQVWYDTNSLWTDEIEKEPVRAPNAYNNLGFNYFNKYNESVDPAARKRYYDSSYYLLNKAISLQPTFVNPYISLGELERTAGNFPAAKRNYYTAISLKSFDEDANAYLGLAIIYAIQGESHLRPGANITDSMMAKANFDSSIYCFRSALKLKPYFPEAISNYGNLLDMIGQKDSALVQYGTAIAQNPDMYAPYLNRGRLLQRMGRNNEALQDYAKALEIAPDMGEIYYARSMVYAVSNKPRALQDINKAISLGFRGIDKRYYLEMGGK